MLENIASIIWGKPLLIFLISSGTFLLYRSRLAPLRYIIYAMKLLTKQKSENDYELGDLTHFQALCNALAATIGMGNIAGVAVAIYQGGPGAIFWMWIAALIGMNTKFFECTLAIRYRGVDYQDNVQGGPMYYIEQALPPKYGFLAKMFAVFGLIGTLAVFQMNQLAAFADKSYEISPLLTGMIFSLLTLYVLLGGIKRIASFTSKLVPFMSIFYVIMCLIIISINLNDSVELFKQIFLRAFAYDSLTGGISGTVIARVMEVGFRRAAFSNEAGVGTAPMAHGNAKTSNAIHEGFVGMLGPLFDTIIVCTMTAIVVLLGMKGNDHDLNGINLTFFSVEKFLGEAGALGLTIIIILFSFTTMVGMANYNKKCWDYLFKGKYRLGHRAFLLYYSVAIFIAAIIKMENVIHIIDISYALMALPNIIALVLLSGTVKELLENFRKE